MGSATYGQVILGCVRTQAKRKPKTATQQAAFLDSNLYDEIKPSPLHVSFSQCFITVTEKESRIPPKAKLQETTQPPPDTLGNLMGTLSHQKQAQFP